MCYSSDGQTLPDHIPDNCDMVFVCEEFEGHAFDYLHSRKLRSVPPPPLFLGRTESDLGPDLCPVAQEWGQYCGKFHLLFYCAIAFYNALSHLVVEIGQGKYDISFYDIFLARAPSLTSTCC